MIKLIYIVPEKSKAFKNYRLSLKLDSFKCANWLLLFASISLLINYWYYYPAEPTPAAISTDGSGTSQSPAAAYEAAALWSIFAWSRGHVWAITLVSWLYICLLNYVISQTIKQSTRNKNNNSNDISNLEQTSISQAEANQIERDDDSQEDAQRNLRRLQIISLVGSISWATILSILDVQLVSIQLTVIFIVFTLLAINESRATKAILIAFCVHLIGYLIIELCMILTPIFTQQQQQHENDANLLTAKSYHKLTTRPLLFSTCYLLFYSIGRKLNEESQDDCRKSFDDIKKSVAAKSMMENEDKKLTKLMESVIPKFLASRMRHDILSTENNTGNFNNIYLEFYDQVSILFADIVNFTKISSSCSAQLLVETLNELFGRFDKAADKNHCLRIKILGDCYYCVCGLPNMNKEHAISSVEMGLDMIDILGDLAQDNSGVDLNMRVGIHSGRVLCGVLGKKKWQFDVHSNDVKLANHMEQAGIPGRVHITEDTLKALDERYQVEPANGHLRDTYIAQRNISTYFVIPPSERRASQDSVFRHHHQQQQTNYGSNLNPTKAIVVSVGPTPATTTTSLARHQTPSFKALPAPQRANAHLHSHPTVSTMTLDTTGVGRLGLNSEAPSTGTPNQLHQDLSMALKETAGVGASLVAAANRTGFEPHMQHLNSSATAKLRFRLATQRIINALHFIKTIDAPFADLEAPKTDQERLMQDTISSRCNIQDVHPISLKFKDSSMAQLYGLPTRRLRILRVHIPILLLFVLMMNIELLISAPNEDRIRTLSVMILIIIILLLAFSAYIHQVELNARRDFLWRQMAIKDKAQMARMRDCNRFIFFNILPPHVGQYFLEKRVAGSHMDLYHKSYDRIGVVFAAISNFSDFYSEVQGNNHGLECLRVLNEIICDFDSILDDERFKAVDKIKTIGSTYMAAVGLFPNFELPSDPIGPLQAGAGAASSIIEPSASVTSIAMAASSVSIADLHDAWPTTNEPYEPSRSNKQLAKFDQARWNARKEVARYLQILVKFVLEMKLRLQDINEHSFNSFKLRVGINMGPVTAGVIGASKPQYDIWGNTVNVASRMETTAEPNSIQITEDVYEILKDFNGEYKFKFTCRGSINVKGKGFMTTYYLDQ